MVFWWLADVNPGSSLGHLDWPHRLKLVFPADFSSLVRTRKYLPGRSPILMFLSPYKHA
jgi:hypothetical protein